MSNDRLASSQKKHILNQKQVRYLNKCSNKTITAMICVSLYYSENELLTGPAKLLPVSNNLWWNVWTNYNFNFNLKKKQFMISTIYFLSQPMVPQDKTFSFIHSPFLKCIFLKRSSKRILYRWCWRSSTTYTKKWFMDSPSGGTQQ